MLGIAVPALYVTANPIIFGEDATLDASLKLDHLRPPVIGIIAATMFASILCLRRLNFAPSMRFLLAGALYGCALGHLAIAAISSPIILSTIPIKVYAAVHAWGGIHTAEQGMGLLALIMLTAFFFFIPPVTSFYCFLQAEALRLRPSGTRNVIHALIGGIIALSIPALANLLA